LSLTIQDGYLNLQQAVFKNIYKGNMTLKATLMYKRRTIVTT